MKDVIYLDYDDDITGVVAKIKNSNSKIVAMVLPKRAALMQSSVNMRLLKKASDGMGKQLVLITSEDPLRRLAGASGMYVAPNLQTKPEIPHFAKEAHNAADDSPIDIGDKPDDAELDKSKPVGELAAGTAAASAAAPFPVHRSDDAQEDDITDEMDREKTGLGQRSSAPAAAVAAAAGPGKRHKPDRSLKVPNFNLFRKRLLLLAGGLLLFVGVLFWAFAIAPKATIAIKTDTTTLENSISFTADTQENVPDMDKNILPAVLKQDKKTDTAKAQATGEKDKGTKASGTVTLSTPCSGNAPEIPAGSGVSSGDLTFITQEDVDWNPPQSVRNCRFEDEVNVVAQKNGDSYNLPAGRTFSVSGESGSSISASNDDAFSGGTSKLVKVVSQADIDGAKAKLPAAPTGDSGTALKKSLADNGYMPLEGTYEKTDTVITASPRADEEASEVTVTATTTFSIYGVKKDDLQKMAENKVKKQIDAGKQQIKDLGMDKAGYNINSRDSKTARLDMELISLVMPKIDAETVRKESAGKKRGQIEKDIGAIPGVREVVVRYSPMWVYSTPKSEKKINVVFENPR